jgi:NTP pyrophosphatase (non-canonical NTP hydrolase)
MEIDPKISIAEFQQKQHEWSDREFAGSHYKNGHPNPWAPFNHLATGGECEIGELRRALTEGNLAHIAKELGDCFSLLSEVASLLEIDLGVAAQGVLAHNLTRTWYGPDDLGVYRHNPDTFGLIFHEGCLDGHKKFLTVELLPIDAEEWEE